MAMFQCMEDFSLIPKTKSETKTTEEKRLAMVKLRDHQKEKSKRQKYQKYEDSWKAKKKDLFDEVLVDDTSDRRSSLKQHVEALTNRKAAAASTNLLVTPNNNIRDVTDMEGIRMKKADSTKTNRALLQIEFKRSEEKRTHSLKHARTAKLEKKHDDPFFRVDELTQVKKKERVRLSDDAIAKRLHKEEAEAIKALVAREKVAKKNRKIARRAQIETESRDRKPQTLSELLEKSGMSWAEVEFLGRHTPFAIPWQEYNIGPEVEFAIQTFILLENIWKGRKDGKYFGILYLYMSSQTELNFLDKAWMSALVGKTVRALKSSPKLNIVTESKPLSSMLDDISTFGDYIFDSVAAVALQKFIVCVASMQIFPKDVAMQIHSVFGKAEKMSAVDLVRNAIEALADLVRMGEMVIAGTPLSEVMNQGDPIQTALIQAKELLLYQDKIYTGLPTPGYYEQGAYMAKLTEITNFFDITKTKMNPYTKVSRDLREIRLQLIAVKTSVEAKIRSGGRQAPFAIVLHGDPSIGKSQLLLWLASVHASVKGREFNENQIFTRSKTSDYWEGYLPFSHPYVHYSELGSDHVDIVKAKGDPRITELTSIIDSLSCPLDMAFGDKGKNFMLAEMILVDTNNPELHLKKLASNPAAFKRRFLYIRPIVKPEYRMEGSCGIDQSKCREGRYLDRWTFEVYRDRPVNSVDSTRQVMMRGGDEDDIYALNALLRREYSEHINKQEDIIRMRSDDFKAGAYDSRPEDVHWRGFDEKEIVSESLDLRATWRRTTDWVRKEQIAIVDYVRLNGRTAGNVCFYAISSLMLRLAKPTAEQRNNADIFEVNWFRSVIALLWSILYASGGFQSVLFFIVICMIFLNYAAFSTILSRKSYNAAQVTVSNRLNYHINSLKITTGWSGNWRDNLALPDSFGKVAILTGLAIGSGIILSQLTTWFTKIDIESEAQSTFVDDTKHNEDINKYEELVNAGRSYKRVGNAAMDVWNVQMSTKTTKHQDSLETLANKVMRNVRRCMVTSSTRSTDTMIVGLTGNVAMINSHALGIKPKSVEVNVSASFLVGSNEQYFRSVLRECDMTHLGNDITLIRLSQVQFHDIVDHVAPDSILPVYAKGFVAHSPINTTYIKDLKLEIGDAVASTITLASYIEYEWADHSHGRCGLPVVINKDKGCCFVGIHTAGDKKSNRAFATVFDRDLIKSGLDTLAKSSTLMNIMSESCELPFETVEPIPKSAFCHEQFRGVLYYGKEPGSVMVAMKSRLQRTFLMKTGYLGELFFDKLAFIPEANYERPVMQPFKRHGEYISPYNITLRKLSTEKVPLNRDLLEHVVGEFTDHIIAGLNRERVPQWNPLTMEAAINGVEEDAFLRRINSTTSGGYGWVGTKDKYIPVVIDLETSITREAIPSLKERVLHILDGYMNDTTCSAVYKAQLKDEPREHHKVLAGKTRMFYGSPLDMLIVARMFLAPFYTHVVEFGDVFYAAVGIDMHRQAHELYSDLGDFSPFIIEGDYGMYDTGLPYDIRWAASTVIYETCKRMGYNESALKILRGLLSDNLFPWVTMLLDMLKVPGLQPSGKYGTAEDNCICGVIMLMYAWYSIVGDLTKKFDDNVRPKTYGDDVLASVKEAYTQSFNSVTYARFVGEKYGMEFTTAAKGDTIDLFTPMDKMSFLKRTFIYKEDLRRIVAPLALESVFRSLQWFSPSKFENEETQMCSTIMSALRELYFITDEKSYYDIRRSLGEEFIRHYEISNTRHLWEKLPTYADLTQQLSLTIETESGPDRIVVKGEEQQLITRYAVDAQHCECLLQYRDASGCEMSPQNKSTKQCNCWRFLSTSSEYQWQTKFDETLKKQRQSLEAEYKMADAALHKAVNPLPGHSPTDLRRSTAYHTDPAFREACDEYIKRYHAFTAVEKSLIVINRCISRRAQLETESHDVSQMTDGTIKNMTANENLTDVGGDVNDTSVAGNQVEVRRYLQTPLELRDFFARPVQISSFAIVPESPVLSRLRVWDIFLNDAAVRAKLRNYAFIRGNLWVRIAISGTPFHYGKLLVSYYPFASVNDVLINYYTLGTSWGKMINQYHSQAPGAKVLDVKDNAPFDLLCPYVSPQPVIRLFNNSTAVQSGSYDDAYDMGTLFITSLNEVKCTAPTPSSVYVYVYAWMTDVELGCPTGSLVNIVTESRDIDERKVGPVEAIATSSETVAMALTTVPFIAPFARASAMVLGGLSKIAAIMGWSYPVNTNHATRIKNEPYQNGANVVGMDTGKRITLDPRQELTIDPRYCAVDEDELSLAYITGIVSYLTTFTWNHDTASLATPIFNAIVHPRTADPLVNETINVQPTALAFAATPFQYWRGTIVFKFEVVCSSFHRGKLMFYYEPNIRQRVLIDGVLDTNKQYVKVIDIQETQSFELCVDWAFPKPWAMQMSDADVATSCGDGFAVTPTMWNCANGYIGVTPFTKLQSPDNSDISVNVYMYSEDMAFNRYTAKYLPTSRTIVTESRDIVTESRDTALREETCLMLNPTDAPTDKLSIEYFGERPTSFRALLKRFATTGWGVCAGISGSGYTVTGTIPIFPKIQPTLTTPTGGAVGSANLLSYLRYAYLAMRGSLRKRIHISTGGVMSNLDGVLVGLDQPGVTTANFSFTGAANIPLAYTLDGNVAFMPSTNGGIEFELPYYSNNLFAYSCTENPYDGTDSPMETVNTRNYTFQMTATGNAEFVAISEHTATGEDFSFTRWLGAPPYVGAPPS